MNEQEIQYKTQHLGDPQYMSTKCSNTYTDVPLTTIPLTVIGGGGQKNGTPGYPKDAISNTYASAKVRQFWQISRQCNDNKT